MLAFGTRYRPWFRHVFQLANSYCTCADLRRTVFRTVRNGEMDSAMTAYYKLKEKDGVDTRVVNSLLHLCQTSKDVRYVDEVVTAARNVPKPDDTLSLKLLSCLLAFGKLSEAWELYGKLSSDGVTLRLGTIEALARASIAQNKLRDVLPLLEVLERKDTESNKLEPQFAQELLTAALEHKEEQVFRAVVQLYNSMTEPVPVSVVDPLVKWIERIMNAAVSTRKVVVGSSHECSHCHKQLIYDIGSDKYQQLLQHMESRLRSEVGSVTTSTVLVDDFCYLLERESPFYAVVDGLNMAYNSGHFNINHLNKSLKTLSAYGKVLVIARSHLARDMGQRERTGSMSELKHIYRRRNVHLFFTKNKWADDLYFLYGTLYSGPDTLFVSGDSMGNHAQGMTKELSRAFKLWLATRQVKHSYNLEFPKAVPVIHQDTQSWHIPVYDKDTKTNEPDATNISYWLCVTAK